MKNKSMKLKKLWIALSVILVCAIAFGVVLVVDRLSNKTDLTMTEEEAAVQLREALDALPLKVAKGSVYVVENTTFEVLSVEYGTEKDVLVTVSYSTPDAKGMYEAKKESIFAEVWQYWQEREAAGRKTGATNILALLNKSITPVLEEQPKLTGETTVVFYDTGAEKPQLYLSDETLDTLLGGYITVRDDITSTTKITVDGETFDIEKNNTIRTGIANYFGLNNYDAERPDTSTPLTKVWNSFVNDLHKNFIEGDRWKYLATGLGNTLAITGLALILGIVLGFLSAVVRVVHEQTGKMVFLDRLVKLYVSVIRGTPIMVQLLIIYFVLLLPAGVDKFPAAVLCFGLNSGAYVSEIIRGGIMSIDQGQTEAGRSLGFGFGSTMIHIILPQAFKAVLPSLCNEFITLLKETSVAFYIGVADLTQGGLKIRSITYSNFMPLIAVALIYLVLVLILTKLVGILERRLRKSER